MNLDFKRIPKIALYLYLLGFSLISLAMAARYFSFLEPGSLVTQQIFIGGAIIVALGSLVNTINQFGLNKKGPAKPDSLNKDNED